MTLMFPYDPTLETPLGNDLTPVEHAVACPQVQYYTNPINGRKEMKIWRCNNKRTCPNCRKLEAENYKARMWRAYQETEKAGDHLVYAVVPSDSLLSEEIKRKITKEGRWTIPLQNGETYHVMRLSEAQKLQSLAECQPVDTTTLPGFDYEALVQSPSREKHGTGGKQASGKLGKPAPTPAGETKTTTVEVLTFTTDLDSQTQEKIDRQVVEMTKDLNPKEVEAAVTCADEVTTLRMKLYEEAGGTILSVGKRALRLPENVYIDWGYRNIFETPGMKTKAGRAGIFFEPH